MKYIDLVYISRCKTIGRCVRLPNPPYKYKALSKLRYPFSLAFVVPQAALVFSTFASAQETPTQRPFPPEVSPVSDNADIAIRIDPTDFKNRFDFRYEFNQYTNASYQSIVPRFEYALNKSLALRAELPIARYDLTDDGSSSGIGNLLTRVAWRAVRNGDYALVVGTDLTFDTASSANLGSGKNVLAPFAFVAIELPRAKSQFFLYTQRGKAIGGDINRQDVDYSNVRGSLLSRLPERVYTFLEYSYWIDHHNGGVSSSQIRTEVGKFFFPKTGFYIRPGAGLTGSDKQFGLRWSLEFGVRHFF